MKIPVKSSRGGYDIFLERSALRHAGEYWNLNRRVYLVTDDGVPAEYAEALASQCHTPTIHTLPQGESTKCLQKLEELLGGMVQAGLTRSDCVVAVGGGVIGDLAGFAASVYMRGIDFYNLPTTVLSQVDSSIGGKVAVDFRGFKNLVGAFYPPNGVIVDPDVLKTLPDRQIANGMAEAIKMGLTSDPELFALFERGEALSRPDEVIRRSLLVKRSVVEQDEKENGLRRILNFGHTLAHAVEAQNGLTDYYHGECVAFGMIPMCAPKVRARLIPVLQSLGLPTALPCRAEILTEAMQHDKKKTGDSITVVYVPEIGRWEMRELPFEKLAKEITEAVCK